LFNTVNPDTRVFLSFGMFRSFDW